MDLTLATHLRDLVVLVAIFGAPLRAALWVANTVRPKNGEERFVVAIVAWIGIQTALAMTLGLLHCFTLRGLLVADLVVSAGSLACPRQSSWLRARALSWRRRLLGVVDAAVVCFAAALLVRLAIQPVTNYDSLAYHLPAMARWYQDGALTRLEQWLGQVAFYPFGWELLASLTLFAFRGDFMVTLANLLAWLLFVGAIDRLSVELGIQQPWGRLAALITATTPPIIGHVTTMLVDLPLAALTLAAAALAVSWRDARWSGARVVVFAMALGLIVGIKMTGVVYATLVVALAALLRWHAGPTSPEFSARRALPWLAGAATFFWTGGTWYARNLMDTGNPLGFLELRVFGITLFSGARSIGDVSATTLGYLFMHDGLSAVRRFVVDVATTAGPVTLVAVVALAGLLSSVRRVGRQTGWLAAALALGFLVYVTTPFTATPVIAGPISSNLAPSLRFGFVFVGLMGVAAARGLEALARSPRLVVGGGLVVAALAFGSTGGAVVVACAGAALTVALSLAAPLSRPMRGAVITIALAAALGGTAGLRTEYLLRRDEADQGLGRLLERLSTPRTPIAYVLTDRAYFLYGPNLDRRVTWVPPVAGDRIAWLGWLDRHRIRLVAVGPLASSTGPELAWLRRSAEFVPLLSADVRLGTALYWRRARRNAGHG